MKTPLLTVLALMGMLVASPVLALDLQDARAQGMVGERLDGYVTSLKETAEVKALVANVNDKRKQEYTRISKEKGQPVDVVAKLAAQEIINKLAQGSSYQLPDGSWSKR